MGTTDLKSFNYLENGSVTYSILNTKEVRKDLLPGYYSIATEGGWGQPITVTLNKVNTTNMLMAGYHKNKEMLDTLFCQFMNPEIRKKINEMGFLHKVGVLFHGKEGSGKTTILNNYCCSFIKEYSAIVFNVVGMAQHLSHMWELISNIRKIQDNPIIVMFDEFDGYSKEEPILKTMLDGNLSIDNCMVFASTNYIEAIPVALKERPSRFKHSFAFDGLLTKEFIKDTLIEKIGNICTLGQIEEFTAQLKNDTIDNIKQFCLDRVMDIDTAKTEKRTTIGFKR